VFFAVWWRGERRLPSLASRVEALLQRSGRVLVEEANAAVAAWPPGRIKRAGGLTIASAASTRSGGSLPGHPSVRLEGHVLVIAAGPLPQYPAYYAVAEDGSYLLACSQLGQLVTLLPTAPLNAQRLVSLIAYGFDTDTDATPYVGIRRLRPSETIVGDRDGLRVSREFPRIAGRYRVGNPKDLAVELRQRLDAAVKRAIGDADRVAVFVSGGLDSSGVLALAAADCRGAPDKELDAISIEFAGPGDDRPHFAQLVSLLGLAPVRLRPQDAAPLFRQSMCADAQPNTVAAAPLDLLQCVTAIERRADVVMTGVYGDVICGGLHPFVGFTQQARRGHFLTAVNGALRLPLPWHVGPLLRLRYALSPLIPEGVRRVKLSLARAPVGPAWLTSRARELLAKSWEVHQRAVGPLPATPDGWWQYVCTNGYMADNMDTAGQAATLTHCFPVDVFRDVEFARFMLELDPALLSYGQQYRGLYRLAMKGLLPETLRTRRDKGSFEPAIAAAAIAGEGIDILRDLSSLEALASRGLADPERLRPTFDACLAMLRRGERGEELPVDEHIQDVWQLLSVEAFLRERGRGRELA
jgi:asparagine synthase (glutamine-hydrolysing)